MSLRNPMCAALALLLPSLAAQDELLARVQNLEAKVQSLRELPGVTLKVNGKPIPPEAWQRSLIYISGRQFLEEKILQFIIADRIDALVEEELQKAKSGQVEPLIQKRLKGEEDAFLQANPGKSWDEWLQTKESSRADRLLEIREEEMARFKLPDEEKLRSEQREMWRRIQDDPVKERIEQTIRDFRQQNPDVDFWKEVEKTGTSVEEYYEIARATLLFDRLFFQGEPKDWPAITREAIYDSAGENGKQFFDSIEKSVSESKDKQVPPMIQGIFRKWCLDKLKQWADIRYASDGIAPEFVMVFNDRPYHTADAFRRLQAKISEVDRNRALQEVILSTALREELQKAGVWVDDKAFAAAWKEHCQPYEGSLFTIELIATQFKGYPSMEAYRARFRIIESYRRLLERENLLGDEHLEAFIPEVAMFLGNGTVNAELIRFPAKDDSVNKWLPGGFAIAKAKAEVVLDEIEAGRLLFGQARLQHGRWPKGGEQQGVIAGKSRNEMRRELGEHEFGEFILGYSITDYLLDHAPLGKVVGPIRGMDGYYLALVTSRSPAREVVTIKDPQNKEMIRQEYLTRRFLKWANEVAGKIQVE